MGEKILVTTDLSVNSASAIHFAYKISQLRGATLVIVHIYHLLRPISWRAHRFESYHHIRRQFILNRLNKLLDRIFSQMNEPLINYEIDLLMNPNTITSILDYIGKQKFTFLCISSRGTNREKKNIGNTASKLIVKSSIPVFCIQKPYKEKPINGICYASDMNNYQKELKKIIELIKPFNTSLTMLHIISSTEILPKNTVLETKLFKRLGVRIKVKYMARNSSNSLAEDINMAIKKIKPSVTIFFINRSKPNLLPMFYISNGESLSFNIKLPLLFFKK